MSVLGLLPCLGRHFLRPVRGRGARVVGTQTDAPQSVVGACFGEATVAGLNKGKVHFLVLGELRKVAM